MLRSLDGQDRNLALVLVEVRTKECSLTETEPVETDLVFSAEAIDGVAALRLAFLVASIGLQRDAASVGHLLLGDAEREAGRPLGATQ